MNPIPLILIAGAIWASRSEERAAASFAKDVERIHGKKKKPKDEVNFGKQRELLALIEPIDQEIMEFVNDPLVKPLSRDEHYRDSMLEVALDIRSRPIGWGRGSVVWKFELVDTSWKKHFNSRTILAIEITAKPRFTSAGTAEKDVRLTATVGGAIITENLQRYSDPLTNISSFDRTYYSEVEAISDDILELVIGKHLAEMYGDKHCYTGHISNIGVGWVPCD